MKKWVITIVFLLACIFSLIKSIFNDSIYFHKQWKVWLPEPNTVVELLPDENAGMDGYSLACWNYSSVKMEKIIQNNHFKKITEEEIMPLLERYKQYVEDSNKDLFEKKLDIERLLEHENYYAYFNDEDHLFHFTILITDIRNNRLYKLLVW